MAKLHIIHLECAIIFAIRCTDIRKVCNFAADNTKTFPNMRKNVTLLAAVACMALGTALDANAGGLLTNTNQSAAFLRQMSQNAVIDITSLSNNPAGTAFLNNGWHFALTSQTAKQQRNITTQFPLFALNAANPGSTTREFKGKAFAPVIPSFQLNYNADKWSVGAAFAVTGGGGKCKFDDGLGSFEALYAGQLYQMIPAAVNAQVGQLAGATLPGMVQGQVSQALVGMGIPETYANMIAATTQTNYGVGSQMTGYGMDMALAGRNYIFGLQLGGTYKFSDQLAGFVGLRALYATNNYNGYVKNVNANYAYAINYSYNVPANAQLGFPGTSGEGVQNGTGTQNLDANGLELDADQTGFGVTPIIGLDWRPNKHWNLAAKFESPTKLVLKNSSVMNDYAKAQIAGGNATLGQFEDGAKIREDIPGLLALGVQYSPADIVRINAGFHEYFDKSAKKYADKQELIDHNTWEVNAGVEVDVCKYLTLSGSYQVTQYGLSEAYMNDLSYNLSNSMVGAGLRINAAKCCSIDLGYMHTFYGDRTITTPTAAGPKEDAYVRKNDVFAVGVNFAF